MVSEVEEEDATVRYQKDALNGDTSHSNGIRQVTRAIAKDADVVYFIRVNLLLIRLREDDTMSEAVLLFIMTCKSCVAILHHSEWTFCGHI